MKTSMPLKIKRLVADITVHPLRADRVVVSAAGTHDRSEFLTVTLENGDGLQGFGEAATTLLWSGETAQGAKWLIDSVFAPRLVGASYDHPRDALAVMDRLAVGNPFAKSAVDTALWDFWAKQQGVPASKLFGDRAPVPAIPTRVSLGAYPLEK